ncbi:MAG: S8 family serine peptidase [Candidatus Pacebacteria bacterium]|nr:S8 family serine peptidase [Candidatus Paceibacterota bacterium]
MKASNYFLSCSILIAIFLASFNGVLAYDTYSIDQGFTGAYNISKGKDVVVAVISGGVQIDHPDLKDAIWTNAKELVNNKKDDDKNGFIDDIHGWNFIDKNAVLTPKDNYGTQMAGVIAARPDNNIGIAGIAPEAKIMPLIACDSKGCQKQAIIEAINYAANNGAKIITFGLGASNYVVYSADYNKAINAAYSKGVLVVASAGNGDVKSTKQVGRDIDKTKVSPASNDGVDINMVLGVGASVKGSSMKANWANYGSKVIDVWAPGVSLITTTVPTFSKKLEYETVSGSHLSAAIVSGSAALLISKYPELKIYQIIPRLRNTAPFTASILLTNTIYTSACSIYYVNKEVKNGSFFYLDADNLRPDVALNLTNVSNNSLIHIPASDISIIDYNKLRVDTSKLYLPAGLYYVNSNYCSAEGKINIKGELKKPEVQDTSKRNNLIDMIKKMLISR